VITTYALPGSIAHYFLKHVDVKLALLLILGVIPGAYLGSKITIKLRESLVRFLFGLFLLIIALYFAYFEYVELGIKKSSYGIIIKLGLNFEL